MLYYTYAYKSEEIDTINGLTIYKYRDCFTEQIDTVYEDKKNMFADIEYEAKNRIICDGRQLSGDLTKHIVRLMRPRSDDNEFTDIKVYLVVDGIVSCNIDLSTAYFTVMDIDNFIRTLIISTENTGKCELMIEFLRPDIDCDTFTLNKKY